MVRLSEAERDEADAHGLARYKGYLNKQGRVSAASRYKRPEDQILEQMARGCRAEMAVAKALGDDVLDDWRRTKAFVSGAYWEIKADCGESIQVRSVLPGPKPMNLLVRPKDPEDAHYVLVEEWPDWEYALIGWVHGREAKTARNWREHFPVPCFAVGRNQLHPMDELPPTAVRKEDAKC